MHRIAQARICGAVTSVHSWPRLAVTERCSLSRMDKQPMELRIVILGDQKEQVPSAAIPRVVGLAA